MRKEREELWAMLNTDKYKNYKSIEEASEKFQHKIDKITSEYEQCKTELEQTSGKNKELEE